MKLLEWRRWPEKSSWERNRSLGGWINKENHYKVWRVTERGMDVIHYKYLKTIFKTEAR